VEEFREGYYKDASGNWQVDRRRQRDRRGAAPDPQNHERRRLYRRLADREESEKDRSLINEALEEFAVEHHGHL